MKSLLSPLFILLVSSSTQAQEQPEPCNVCVGDGTVDPAASLGPIPCADWLEQASTTPNGVESCTLHRAAGARFCGCGNPQTFETCYLCGDASSNAQADATKYIPDSPDGSLTCADMLEMPNVDAGATCPLIQEKYQRWCGCPNAAAAAPTEESCPFCELGGTPNLEKEFPFKDGSGRSCSQLNDWYQVQTAASCPASRQSDAQFYLIDMQAYCECPGRDPPRICEGPYCPTGQGVLTEDLTKLIDEQTGITCGMHSFLMDMMTRPQDCELLYSTTDMCCSTAKAIIFETEGGFASAATFRGRVLAVLGASFLAWANF